MLKKLRNFIRKIRPGYFLLFTLVTTHLSVTRSVVSRGIE